MVFGIGPAKSKYFTITFLIFWTLIVIWAMSGRAAMNWNKPKAENPFDVLKKEIKNKMTGRFDEKLAQISADMSKLQLFLDDEDRRKRGLPTFDSPIKPDPEVIKESLKLNGPYTDDRRPFKDAVIDLASVLQSIGVRAFLMGGSLLGWYRDNTSTGADIDFGVLRGDWDSKGIMRAMKKAGWGSQLIHGNFSNDGFEIRFAKRMKSEDYEKTIWGDLFLYDKWEFKDDDTTDVISHAYTYGYWTKKWFHYRGRITGEFDFVPACFLDGHEDVIFYVPYPTEPWMDQQLKGDGEHKWMERISTGPKGLTSPMIWDTHYPTQYLMLPDWRVQHIKIINNLMENV